jgi:hypothetical protein
MSETAHTPDNQSVPASVPPKREYHAPELRYAGDLDKLTDTVQPGSSNDSGGANSFQTYQS